MDIVDFLNKASSEQICRKIADLAKSDDINSLNELAEFLIHKDSHTYDSNVIPYLACRGMLQKGSSGVQKLVDTLKIIDGSIYPQSIINSLWSASNGKLNTIIFKHFPVYTPLDEPLKPEVIEAAKDAFYDFIIECHTDPELFSILTYFLYTQSVYAARNKEDYVELQSKIFKILSDSSIRITKELISKFVALIDEELREEEYQKFLEQHPVFIDALASNIINKHKLGDDLITDFVIETLKGEYLIIEIEKPQDKIFNKNGDFSNVFSHAFGQVIGFLDWIASNIAYAERKLPGITAPRGLLIMGRTKDLKPDMLRKLRIFNKNSNNIEILTYDDVVSRADSLYKNLKRKDIYL
jgi:hypothetical protein